MVQPNRVIRILLFYIEVPLAQRRRRLPMPLRLVREIPGEHARMLLCRFKQFVRGRTDDTEAVAEHQIKVLGLMVLRSSDDRIEALFAHLFQGSCIGGVTENADGKKRLSVDQRVPRRIERYLRPRFSAQTEREQPDSEH